MTRGTNGSERPLIDAAEEAQREAETRKRLCRERIAAMKDCLERAGYTEGTSYWSVGIIIAKVATGWESIEWELDRLASDRELATSSDNIESRRRIVRRALAELQADGMVTFECVVPSGRRGRGHKSRLTIELNRAVIVGDSPLLERAQKPDTDPDNGPDTDPDNGPDRTGTLTRTEPGQIKNQTALYSFPKDSGPLFLEDGEPKGKTEGAEDHEFSRLEFSTTADATVPTCVRLLDALGSRNEWPAGDVQTVWRVAAALDAGLIAEADAMTAARVARDFGKRSRVGLFRCKLAERLELDSDGLARLLSRVRMKNGYPAVPPVRRVKSDHDAAIAASVKAAPVQTRPNERTTQTAARRLFAELVSIR
ncbi:hypothetical protein [Neorhodopirellula pilleata]|uniref:Uncharacterized protein n=1 Tax=Neorhodopirellula pilleata TaxID=2714738 RepID=A0A5C5ZVT1_9BACT|nr:hypothetical protein [Neorhodopirellula pilleata]TWT91419.1 hypothetical protein Pla100_52690 [Neorhodopirellula pilleata]TWT91468.1 hypothetical protein Pla100_53180 [Neorhodopirellula pilleata]